ncbi:MAG: hypothetical protein ACRDYX_12295 [Egibacteraceae bacterium]
MIVAEGRDLHRAAFAAGEDLKVVAQVSDGSSAPECAARLEPDAVCVGVGRPDEADEAYLRLTTP